MYVPTWWSSRWECLTSSNFSFTKHLAQTFFKFYVKKNLKSCVTASVALLRNLKYLSTTIKVATFPLIKHTYFFWTFHHQFIFKKNLNILFHSRYMYGSCITMKHYNSTIINTKDTIKFAGSLLRPWATSTYMYIKWVSCICTCSYMV